MLGPLVSRSAAEEPQQTARRLTARYAEQLEELAVWCEGQGLTAEAEKTRLLVRPTDPNKLYVTVLPQESGHATPADDAPAELVEWDRRLFRLRREQADTLFGLSQRAIRLGRISLAFDLVLAAIRQNPDHEAIRRLLGYQKYRDRWHTPYEIARMRAGYVWHEKYGWLLEAHVGQYESGQRYAQGRWITAEEDAQLHRELRNGWRVETEHYTVHTNHSLEAGVALGTKLETLYRVWRRLFVRYFASEAQVRAMFAGEAGRMKSLRHEVVYFRDREEYVRSLKPVFENIEISLGVYVDHSFLGGAGNKGKAYFFAGEESDERTLLHEATHQLFHESRPVPPGVGRQANFCIIEGIAMYMESLSREGDYYVLGGFDDPRMKAAEYRLLEDDFYVPLSEFTTYGMDRVQADPRIATLYSQAAGITHFLIHHDGGRYRDALVAYLATVYSGRDDPNTLSRLTLTPYGQLDREYRQFMESSRANR
jgi:hypothetical protein